MIRILVKSETVQTRSGNAKNGKPYNIRTQSAALDTGADFPAPIRVTLDHDQPAYKPGAYTLSGDSYQAGQYGDIEVSRFARLVPIPAAKAQ